MKLALWQTHPQPDIASALAGLEGAAETAGGQGADLLVTPEMFLGGYDIGPQAVAAHAAQSVQALEGLKRVAVAHGIALVAGLPLPGEPRPFNACVAIDKTGAEIARYHKTHLFGDVDQAQFTAGSALSPVVELNGWKIALAICYDVEFPELTRALALRGAEIIVTPTANMTPYDSIATRLVPARAEENGIYMAYCNYVGAEGQFIYNGLSCVAGPDGTDVVRGTDADLILYATLDRASLTDARRAQTHLADRRPDLYGELT